MRATAREGQCLMDMALRLTGSAEGIWALCERNGLGLTEDLQLGQEVEWEAEDVEDSRVAAKYESEGIWPSTAVTEALMEELTGAEKLIESVPAWAEIKADPVRKAQSTRAQIHEGAFTATFA